MREFGSCIVWTAVRIHSLIPNKSSANLMPSGLDFRGKGLGPEGFRP